MGSISQILGFALVLTNVSLLAEVALILFLVGALVWITTVIKSANQLSHQFLGGQSYKTKKVLNGLADKLKVQELTIQQAEKELGKLGDNSLENNGNAIEGPLGVAITTL